MWWKMTLFCKIFRALNHLTFSMHFNFWEMQVLSWYQDDTHLSVTNFKSNPPLAQQTLNPWDEGGSISVLNCDKIDISQFHMPSENFSTHQSVNFQFSSLYSNAFNDLQIPESYEKTLKWHKYLFPDFTFSHMNRCLRRN